MRTPPLPKVIISPSYQELCHIVAQQIIQTANAAIDDHGRCVMALCGGTTPAGIYTQLAARHYQDQLDWRKIHVFLGDERVVPAGSARHNFTMIQSTLLDKIKIPAANVHPVDTAAASAADSAAAYEKDMRALFGVRPPALPRFDVMLLGLGEDGHTASLFPGSKALEEKSRLAVPVKSTAVPEPRVSLTLPVLNNAANILFAVSGAAKKEILKKIIMLPKHQPAWPAQRVVPVNGRIWWFVDREAAGDLTAGGGSS